MSKQYQDKELDNLFANHVFAGRTLEEINKLKKSELDKLDDLKSKVAQLIAQKQLEVLNAIGEPALQDVGLMQPDQYEGGVTINSWYRNRIADLTKQEAGDVV